MAMRQVGVEVGVDGLASGRGGSRCGVLMKISVDAVQWQGSWGGVPPLIHTPHFP